MNPIEYQAIREAGELIGIDEKKIKKGLKISNKLVSLLEEIDDEIELASAIVVLIKAFKIKNYRSFLRFVELQLESKEYEEEVKTIKDLKERIFEEKISKLKKE